MGETGESVQARMRLLALEQLPPTDERIEEWRRLHREIWPSKAKPEFLFTFLHEGEMRYKAGLTLDEALRLSRVALNNGATSVTIQRSKADAVADGGHQDWGT